MVMSENQKIIFHIDVNSAYLSWTAVKMLQEGAGRDIREIPCIVGGDKKSRHGIVLAKSILAKKYGVKTGEPVVNALRKCPDLEMVPPEHGYYEIMSKKLMELLRSYTPDIEQVSIDECYMDYTGIQNRYSSPQEAAETIKNKVKVQGKFIRQSGGKGQYGDVWFEMEPLEPGKGIEFESKIVGGAVPKEYIKPIEQGMREAAESGILAGYPVIDFKVSLVDGSYHEVDSSEMAFKIAASMAFKEGCKQAKSVILEPIMKVEITVPEEYMGDVIGDVNSRRGRMEGMDANDGMQEIHAFIPLSEMFGYATDLRSKTQGRGSYSMEPSHYEEVPKSVLESIVASRAKKED